MMKKKEFPIFKNKFFYQLYIFYEIPCVDLDVTSIAVFSSQECDVIKNCIKIKKYVVIVPII